ncbi:unnamed protein product [Psylliodes chrysocephalus]|uniref:Uncharacterized protein n=1 Tax=Psylliodes chrysocephalus TaxID=3402493 RepID=A0A9P0D0Y0_9CUCU|nr:unnamed protein product [Psylliodes chrysocephala]
MCKVFFLNTLGISETVVRNELKKSERGGFVSQDIRGRHEPKNKLPEVIKEGIRTQIRSFPVYETHYSREKIKKRKYLGSELNTNKIFSLYKLKYEEEGLPKSQIAKPWVYCHIFNTEFNLGFKLSRRTSNHSRKN